MSAFARITKVANRGLLKAKKHSPVILTVVGAAGVVASGVMLVRSTLKVQPLVEDLHDDIYHIKEQHANENPRDYQNTQEYKKDLAKAYVKNGARIVKLYAPAVTAGVVGLTCMIGANGILHKRNIAWAAAYKGIETAYNQYQERMIEELGEDREREIRNEVRTVETTDPETGEVTKVADMKSVFGSPYARFFDQLSSKWDKIHEYNVMFLQQQEEYWTMKLNQRGHVMLNEVYESLGLRQSPEGAIVGWVTADRGTGDGFVDFGIRNSDGEMAQAFLNGDVPGIKLDFNVDGVVWELID